MKKRKEGDKNYIGVGMGMGVAIFLPLSIITKNYGLLIAGLILGVSIGMGMNKDEQSSPEYRKKTAIAIIIGILAVVIAIFAGELFLY